MVVTGANASFAGSGAMYVGSEGSGRLQVTNGASVDRSGNMYVASGKGGRGVLEVVEGSSFKVGGFLQLGNSSMNSQAHALFASGTTAEVAQLNIHGGAVLEINAASVEITGVNISSWNSGSVYRLHLSGPDAVPLSAQSVLLDGAVLDVQLGDGFVASLGNHYSVLNYAGSLTGEFLDTLGGALNEGDEITIGDYIFELTYGTGSNSAVSLELVTVPEPAHAVLVVFVMMTGYSIYRRRLRCKKHLSRNQDQLLSRATD